MGDGLWRGCRGRGGVCGDRVVGVVMPFHRDRYPKDWPKISKRIRERSHDQCECEGECGLHHAHRCHEMNGTKAQWANGKIVLTVAHLDHVPQNCADHNLKAMCQRCHLRYDQHEHKQTARATRRSKKATGDLFD